MLAGWPVEAQVTRELSLHVPFSFVAAEKTLPAGEYTVITNSDSTVLIKNAVEKEHTLFAFTQPTQSLRVSTDAKLVFYRFGESYFLSEVWAGGTNTGRHLRVPAGERLSSGNWPNTRVEILATIGAAGRGKK
jgi:hypothetical protein